MNHKRPRNELGWIIPSEGTMSRAVYECMVSGIGMGEIHQLVKQQWGYDNYSVVAVICSRIRRPDWENERQKRKYQRRSEQLDLFKTRRPAWLNHI